MLCAARLRGAIRAAGVFGLASGLVLVTTDPADAQAVRVQPPRETLDIGREAERRERARERQGLEEQVDRTAPVEGAPLDDAGGDSSFSFRLEGVTVEGSTVYPPEELAAIADSFVGTDVTLGGLREIADRIEARYRSDGYVETRVIIPPQAIRGGVPRLSVFEGKIIHYEVNGEIGPVKQQIARLLDNLLTDEPARWADLERYLLLARDLPGISLTGTLRSAGDSAPGGVILVVDTARKPIDGFINTANQSAEVTGPFTLTGGVGENSATEYAERLGGILSMPYELGEQMTGFMTYEQSLGNEGLVGRAAFTASQARPGDLLKDVKLRTVTLIATGEIEFPIVRSRTFSLWNRGGLEFISEETSIAGNELFEDQFKVLFAGLRGVASVPLGGFLEFDAVARTGLDFIGHSVANSRFDAQTDFTVLAGQASFTQPLPPFFEFFVEASGQVADRPLPSIEEFSLGEFTVGRGFEPGAITGDSGFGIVAEMRYFTPGVETDWFKDFQVFGFFDYGRVYDRGNPTQNPDGFEELYSAGFGSRFRAFEDLFGEVYVAFPMTTGLSTTGLRPDAGFRFNLTKFF